MCLCTCCNFLLSIYTCTQTILIHVGKPYITSVYPNEGWTSGGTKVCIVGMNFFEGIEVIFGTLQASAEVWLSISRSSSASPSALVLIFTLSLPQVLSPNAIAVKAPQSPRTGEVDITLVFKGSQFCISSPGKFLYMGKPHHPWGSWVQSYVCCTVSESLPPSPDPDEVAFDHNFSRLERLLRSPEDPEEIPKVETALCQLCHYIALTSTLVILSTCSTHNVDAGQW